MADAVPHVERVLDDNTSGATAQQEADLMNAVDDYVHAKDPADHLLVVGNEYCCTGPDASTAALGAALHPDIEVMWTGTAVEPATITALNASFKRKLSVWDNWPNAPGGFAGRSKDLPTAITAYYSNPVLNEAPAPNNPFAVFVQVLGPIADWAWRSTRYDAAASYARWQPLMKKDVSTVQPCTKKCTTSGPIYPGWTCDDAQHIDFCDALNADCVTTVACPGGCEKLPNPSPDACH